MPFQLIPFLSPVCPAWGGSGLQGEENETLNSYPVHQVMLLCTAHPELQIPGKGDLDEVTESP